MHTLEHVQLDLEKETSVEQAQAEEPTNPLKLKENPGVSHQYSFILVLLISYNTTLLCIKFIGVG
jgi:hypothetical protein